MSSERAQALIEAMKANRTVNLAAIGMCALLTADYLETLPREVRYMWPSKLSVPKALFFINRYWAFAHTIISVIHHGDLSLSGLKGCQRIFALDAYSCLLLPAVCEAISYVRVYAFAGRNKYLLALQAIKLWVLVRFLPTVEFAEFPPEAHVGCLAVRANSVLLSNIYILVVVSLATVTFIMVFIAYQRQRNTHGVDSGSLFSLFYRDGIWYFVVLSALAVANIIFDHTAPSNGLQFTMVQMQVHMDSILAGRMLLHLREWGEKLHSRSYIARSRGLVPDSTLAELEFRHPTHNATGMTAVSHPGKSLKDAYTVEVETTTSVHRDP
ncbi:hypothetical protein EST38_g664 [Candolleomyces aberdarensis]|uniref:DUF6533 domain-containing protein n=1 Tax=Candolleomyces aberdarensis TaxID=2316362 RepID=A0A4Q2DXR0_9AGAR|nr:hypothetical protein EST38_g664 [Candolleomyces aberdarensis]